MNIHPLIQSWNFYHLALKLVDSYFLFRLKSFFSTALSFVQVFLRIDNGPVPRTYYSIGRRKWISMKCQMFEKPRSNKNALRTFFKELSFVETSKKRTMYVTIYFKAFWEDLTLRIDLGRTSPAFVSMFSFSNTGTWRPLYLLGVSCKTKQISTKKIRFT